MNKKLRLGLAFLALVLVLVGVNVYRSNIGDDSSKYISIVIQDLDGTRVYEESVGTNAATLSELLIEMEANDEIEFVYEDSDYGMYITGMGADTLIEASDSEQTAWTFASDNNSVCVAAGWCPAASDLEIFDEDAFVFSLITY